jgi:hypothetical protein
VTEQPFSAGDDGDDESAAEPDPEEFAEAVGVDPTADEVDEYRERIGDPPPEPPD